MSEGPREERFCKPRLNGAGCVESTKFLYVAGVGDEMGSDRGVIRDFFAAFGELDSSAGDPVEMTPGRRYCYISYESVESAEKAMKFLNSSDCSANYLVKKIGVSKIIVRYAVEKSTLATTAEMECTSSERNLSIQVLGCYVLPNFISGMKGSYFVLPPTFHLFLLHN